MHRGADSLCGGMHLGDGLGTVLSPPRDERLHQRANATRRFRTGYLEIPRKNGKSTLLDAVMGLSRSVPGGRLSLRVMM